ncbi:hypothetical protein KSF_093360 [Reticulibacter mediterranei]|uniref:PatG C-terminal domain-containing protein n=1 Tax=Reticulibacter mediterranei TaxID=2778369 RepID=A0A8J3IRY8_9CHLR|nr:hypothetical protein [Reticulibacter mediterranei]GHO99288.1 hypothetical protein KSF_093360 [Reticulibacter mediterranei]
MEPLEALELPEEAIIGNGTSTLSSNGTALLAPPTIENVTAPLPFVPEPVTGMPSVAIFALGRINVQFPTLAIEKEFAHAASQIDTSGKSDLEARHLVLSAPENRYLLHHLCWVFSVEGLETYILHPRNPAHYDLLVNAIRPVPSNLDVDIVIGMRGELAPPEMCNGLVVPIVHFDQIYSFDRDQLIAAIPLPEGTQESQDGTFRQQAGELFDRMMQMADNAGATDEDRALNFLSVRYPAIYAKAAEQFGKNFQLTGIETHASRLSGARKVMDVIFSYRHRQTDVSEKYFVRVDVTEEYPFLVSKLAHYFSR